MIIEQMIEVPANRRITLEIPPEIPLGKARISVSSVVKTTKTEVSLLSLRGSCKGLDTMGAYFARKQKDKALEDRNDRRKSGNS